MRWTLTLDVVLQALTFVAFFVGAISANLGILFSKEREQLCVSTANEKLMDKFLLGASYFSLAFNLSGFVLSIVGAVLKSARTKTLLWLFKDVLLGLLITAAVVTLLSALDIRTEQNCEFAAKGKWLITFCSLALVFALLYVVFRALMITAK